MHWINFPFFAFTAAVLWLAGGILYAFSKGQNKRIFLGHVFTILGIATLATFIILLWQGLERPPMRTLGETRLWYAFFLPVIGLITYSRWKYSWLLIYSLGLSILFLAINYLNPEVYNKTLMPALQSPWFVPHVLVYIFAYAVLAASSIVAIQSLWIYYKNKSKFNINNLQMADNLVYIGFGFLTLGLMFGALWGKEAWGHYWTWDPKETWAFLTWASYLGYIHYRYFHKRKVASPLWILAISFVVLLICWFGLNYLPIAQNSVHTYTQT
jgi:ABC-type transport system involved in cytochrome c biogenesis permease subunit